MASSESRDIDDEMLLHLPELVLQQINSSLLVLLDRQTLQTWIFRNHSPLVTIGHAQIILVKYILTIITTVHIITSLFF